HGPEPCALPNCATPRRIQSGSPDSTTFARRAREKDVQTPAGSRFFLARLERRNQLRYGLEQVRDQAVIGDLEDRGLWILVDGHDCLRALHAGDVLDRA